MKAILFRSGFSRMVELKSPQPEIFVPIDAHQSAMVAKTEEVSGDLLDSPRKWQFVFVSWVVPSEIALYKFEKEI